MTPISHDTLVLRGRALDHAFSLYQRSVTVESEDEQLGPFVVSYVDAQTVHLTPTETWNLLEADQGTLGHA